MHIYSYMNVHAGIYRYRHTDIYVYIHIFICTIIFQIFLDNSKYSKKATPEYCQNMSYASTISFFKIIVYFLGVMATFDNMMKYVNSLQNMCINAHK